MKLAGLGMWVGVAVLATAGAVSAQAQCEPEELAKLVASDKGKIHNLLNIAGTQEGKAGLPTGHHIRMVAEN